MTSNQRRPRGRANGEGSIFPYKNGYAAYTWVTTPAGERKRKWIYGKTRDEVHAQWVKLNAKAAQGPVPTATPTVADHLKYWLAEVVKPSLDAGTYAYYETMTRLYIVPGIGTRRLDKLTVRHVQAWLNKLPGTCQCCAQGKDERRTEGKRRCCALGDCCEDFPSRRSMEAARNTLRAALNHARREELVSRNVAELVRLPAARKTTKRGKAWTVEEAKRFLESARTDRDPLYALWVLILLGLIWPTVDMDKAEVSLEWQVQRVGRQLIHKHWLKSDGSTDVLPLPAICLTALRLRKRMQDSQRTADWPAAELVFTTRTGRAIEPRNVNRSFDARCAKAGVRRIRVHDTRRTCGSLLAALDVHPRVAMQILRHTKIALTMEIYTLVPDEATRAALKRLSETLSDEADERDQDQDHTADDDDTDGQADAPGE
jgi:integrase